ncbi:hypothetical protein OG2516_08928 [Oceanicola granulosus HTCC2516]|uniref:Uncharacterized protein n=1 Tax=Oceanicola granulosus (strain ATCC BAA-861 / DSM 15982 / KCTC 12143 / HTCC2516) TaxID=314256 RepID=Q2CCR4_OCEGH|nr:hypothetical protein [Oceanicola granulosus]EAR50449.1 hypothetical protein OG2516_08928 [Oceanicola granulosus HTCC2516]
MHSLTKDGERVLIEVAARHGLSDAAVRALVVALAEGDGAAARYDHPDLGGVGRWPVTGAAEGLAARVEAACADIARAMAETRLVEDGAAPGGGDWPAELGQPAASGELGGRRYAIFPGAHRMLVARGDTTEVYDIEGHTIRDVVEDDGGLALETDRGRMRLADLRRDGGDEKVVPPETPAP